MTSSEHSRIDTTRRLLLSSAAGLAAGGTALARAIPPAAATSQLNHPAPDPILAMIENHKSLQATWRHLYDQLDEAESDAAEVHGRRPIGLIHWRNYHIGGSEIDDRRESLLQEAEIPAATIEQEYLDAKARYQAQMVAGLALDERSQLAEKRKEVDRAMTAWRRFARRLAKAKPTTPAGAAALIQCLLDEELTTDDGYWHMAALNTGCADRGALHALGTLHDE
jgi:hypothetical protein